MWNGSYYDLAQDKAAGTRSDICFADQFTYGTVPAQILELGDVHPRDRIRKSVESIWKLNVEPARYVCRMGSHADGTPADATVHKEQEGRASQSNSFTPVSTAPLASTAIAHGMVDEGLALIEETADVIINHVKQPWSGLLLYDSRNGECFYGLHYSDCLILWDVMYALLGLHVDALDRSLKLSPVRVPVKIPVFGRLYRGQVDFSTNGDAVELALESISEQPCLIQSLAIGLPEGSAKGTCSVQEGEVGDIVSGEPGETVLRDLVIPPRGKLALRWG